MSEKAKRHRWSVGLEHSCINKGCDWQRRWRPDARGYATSVLEYKLGRFLGRWETENRVPPCEGVR